MLADEARDTTESIVVRPVIRIAGWSEEFWENTVQQIPMKLLLQFIILLLSSQYCLAQYSTLRSFNLARRVVWTIPHTMQSGWPRDYSTQGHEKKKQERMLYSAYANVLYVPPTP